MANDSDGIVWVFVIGLAIWAYNADTKLKSEKSERIDAVQRAYSQVDDLKLRVSELERQLKFAEGDLASVANAHESLRKTFNSNVEAENRARVAQMTARGACGTETFYPKGGGIVFRNKECTLKDLR